MEAGIIEGGEADNHDCLHNELHSVGATGGTEEADDEWPEPSLQ